MTLSRNAVAPLVVVAVLALAACGSTVAQVPGTATAVGSTSGDGLSDGLSEVPEVGAPGGDAVTPDGGAAEVDDAGAPTGEAPVGTGSGPDGDAATAAGPGPAGDSAPVGGRPRGGGPAGTAKGVTATTIKIGIYTVQGFNDATASAGIKVSTGNQARMARAYIDHINRTGGVAGRKLVPVFHDFNVGAAATDVNSEYQAACASWTQDDRVYAVATLVGTFNDNLYACLSKAGVITSATGESKDAKFFRDYHDYFYMPAEINMTRMLRNKVVSLHGAGFFGKGAKVGVVHLDTTTERRAVAEGLLPALRSVGLKADATFAAPQSADGGSAYSSAVLQFKAEGITHVVFSELGSPIAFASNAESQNYRPRYAFNSRNGPASVLQANVPPAQLRRSMGYGWQPMNDVDAQRDPGPINARQTLCLKLAHDAGEDTAQRSVATVAMYICDSIFLVRDALRAAPDFSPGGFRAGAEALRSYEAGGTFRSGFAPGQLHDGGRAHRLFSFADNCSCFTYTSPVATAP